MIDYKNINDTTPELMLERIYNLYGFDIKIINILVGNIIFSLYNEKILNNELLNFWVEVSKLI